MSRFLCFIIFLLIPMMFGWWLFFPLSIVYIYLAKLPYEIILAALVFDSLYYFGDNFLKEHFSLIFGLVFLVAAGVISERVHWRKKV